MLIFLYILGYLEVWRLKPITILNNYIFILLLSYFAIESYYSCSPTSLINSDSIFYCSIPILKSIPNLSDSSLQAITGNMLGDGSISLSKYDRGQGKYAMTMDKYSLNYINHLDKNIYSQFTETKIYPYPNNLLPQHKDKEVTQYHFKTRTHPLYTALHSLWYKKNNETSKFIKVIPENISEMFSEVSLAY